MNNRFTSRIGCRCGDESRRRKIATRGLCHDDVVGRRVEARNRVVRTPSLGEIERVSTAGLALEEVSVPGGRRIGREERRGRRGDVVDPVSGLQFRDAGERHGPEIRVMVDQRRHAVLRADRVPTRIATNDCDIRSALPGNGMHPVGEGE